jgi:hypothetical protein
MSQGNLIASGQFLMGIRKWLGKICEMSPSASRRHSKIAQGLLVKCDNFNPFYLERILVHIYKKWKEPWKIFRTLSGSIFLFPTIFKLGRQYLFEATFLFLYLSDFCEMCCKADWRKMCRSPPLIKIKLPSCWPGAGWRTARDTRSPSGWAPGPPTPPSGLTSQTLPGTVRQPWANLFNVSFSWRKKFFLYDVKSLLPSN